MKELTTENLVNYIKDKAYHIIGFNNKPIQRLDSFSPQQQLELFIHNCQHYPKDNVESLESVFIKHNTCLFNPEPVKSFPVNHYVINEKTLNAIAQKDFLPLVEQCSLNKLYMDACVLHRCQKMVDNLVNSGHSDAALALVSHYGKISSYVLAHKKVVVKLSFTDKLKKMIKSITPPLTPVLKGPALC